MLASAKGFVPMAGKDRSIRIGIYRLSHLTVSPIASARSELDQIKKQGREEWYARNG
jgi:hypothetical protein